MMSPDFHGGELADGLAQGAWSQLTEAGEIGIVSPLIVSPLIHGIPRFFA